MEHQQAAMFNASGYDRNCSPALYCRGNINGSKSGSTLSSHTLHRGHEKRAEDKPPSPPVRYPLGFGVLFPEKGRTGSLLSPASNVEDLNSSVSNNFPITESIFNNSSADWRSQKLDHPSYLYYLYSAGPAKMKIHFPNINALFLEMKHPLLGCTSTLITMVIITCHYMTVREISAF